jgi:cysteine desulfurase
VVEGVRRALEELWHNPSSVHRPGQAARQAVELARRDVADLVGCKPREITFTSGGTESIDLAIRGVTAARAREAAAEGGGAAEPPVVISDRVEHAAIRDLLEDLDERRQAQVRWAPITSEGVVDLGALESLLTPDVALVSIQWANNETGAIQPIEQVAALCRAKNILLHCDGTQWVGKMPVGEFRVRSSELGVAVRGSVSPTPNSEPRTPNFPSDLFTFSPHKFHGPKGVGILWTRRGVSLRPTLRGTQELGRRGGTENVPGIIGAGIAALEAKQWLADPAPRLAAAGLRDRFERAILQAVPDARVNGPRDSAHDRPPRRLWNTTNIGFPRLEAEALLLLLSEQGLCASAGAACSSGSLDPSPVLLAMGVSPEVAHGSLRFSLSRHTTQEEVDEAAGIVVHAVRRLRESMPAST